jgi:hypothetical protein
MPGRARTILDISAPCRKGAPIRSFIGVCIAAAANSQVLNDDAITCVQTSHGKGPHGVAGSIIRIGFSNGHPYDGIPETRSSEKERVCSVDRSIAPC